MAAAADNDSDARFAMSLQLELFNENEYSADAIELKGQTHRSRTSSRTDTIDLTGDTDGPAHSSSSSSSSSSPSSSSTPSSSSSSSSSSHRIANSTAAPASPPPSPPSSPVSSLASHRAAATFSTSATAALPLFATNHLPGFPNHANTHSRSIRSLFQSNAAIGDIRETYIFNYLFDFDWMVAQLPQLASSPAVHLIGNDLSMAHAKSLIPNVRLHVPQLPIQFGTHHTKMVILIGSAGVRVCIFTANMREQDWMFMNQSMWGQDFPRHHFQQSPFARPPLSAFASDLSDYLRHYPSSLHPLIQTLREFDFSAARVMLLPSVPGYHRGADMHRFGHMRVRALLQAQQLPARFQDATLVCQYSSLGSLTEKWLFDEFGASMSACNGSDDAGGSKSRHSRSKIHCIWPTVEDVRSSVLGYASGGSMPCPDKNMKDFLRPLLHRWRGVDARHAAMPHLKSYARILPSGEIAWAVMTSSNLSKAAWGELQKDGSQLQIRSYELGVLFLPSQYQSDTHAAVAVASKAAFSSGGTNVLGKRKAEDEPQPEPVRFFASASAAHLGQAYGTHKSAAAASPHRFCPFPFDALAPSYQRGDQPWVWDASYSARDSCGLTWPRSGSTYPCDFLM